jgi:hypothetical protein
MSRNKFSVTDSDGKDKSQELADFAKFIGLESAASGRYSLLLVLALYAGLKSGHLNPAKVVHEINALEELGAPSQLKASAPFRHPPLQGLWHKHYLEDGLSAMAINLKKGILKFGIPFVEQRILEAEASGQKRYVSPEDVKLIANDVVHGNWVRLGNAAALTGEWIVYAQYQGANYYLCLGKHDSGDQNLRMQIDTLCCQEFPFLTSILNNA